MIVKTLTNNKKKKNGIFFRKEEQKHTEIIFMQCISLYIM